MLLKSVMQLSKEVSSNYSVDDVINIYALNLEVLCNIRGERLVSGVVICGRFFVRLDV